MPLIIEPKPDIPTRTGGMFWIAAVPERCETFEIDALHYRGIGQSHVGVDANPLYWRSTTVKRSCLTILDGEVIVTQWGFNLCKYLQEICIEIGLIREGTPVLVLNDNNGHITHVKSTNRHCNPRLNSVWAVLRESYNKNLLTLRYICGKLKNIADPLTKVKSPLTSLLLQSIFRGRIEIPP